MKLKRNKHFIAYIFTLCMTVLWADAFGQKKEIQEGDSFFDEYLFQEAIQKYSEALAMPNSEKNEIYILSQIARCYQYSFNYTPAEQYFERLVKLTNEKKPEFVLEHAIMLKFNGKYQEAKEQFRKYQKLTENQDPYGAFQLRSINWAIANDTSAKSVFVTRTNLDISGQSLGYSLFKDGIIYAHARNKAPYYSMPIFSLDYARMIDSLTFEAELEYIDSLGFNGNEGFPSIAPASNKLYFAANATVIKGTKIKKTGGGKQIILNFKIYEASLVDGKFAKVKELSFNSPDYNCTHPFINKDETVIYFASNMPGGFGGYDLYMSKRGKDGNWSTPVNMGKSINSEENEMYPFIHKGVFYYSSKGLNGYGGYDIYAAQLNATGMANNPRNMGKPYNSFRDDFAFISYGDGTTGYLSSNRGNDDGEDEVYFFRELKSLSKTEMLALGSIQDSINKSQLAERKKKEAAVAKNIDSLVVSREQATKDLPMVETNVVVDKKPIIESALKESNAGVGATQSTPPKVQDIPAKPVIEEENDIDENALLKVVFSHVNFGFNETKLVPQVLHILDSAAATIRSGSQIRIEILAHTDSRGSNAYNKELSLKRAAEARAYLLQKGVPSSKIVIRGFGEDKLLNHCKDGVECTEEEHAANRRVELKIVR